MADLVKAIGDFVAALLGLVGFVGRPRRRTAIRDDLQLLRELEEFDQFREGTWPHTWLTNHIVFEIAEFSGLDMRTSRRAIPWSSVVLATFIWVPLGWLTYHLASTGHPWYAVLPAVPAAVFFLATIGMLFQKEEVAPQTDQTAEESEGGDQNQSTETEDTP